MQTALPQHYQEEADVQYHDETVFADDVEISDDDDAPETTGPYGEEPDQGFHATPFNVHDYGDRVDDAVMQDDENEFEPQSYLVVEAAEYE